jgi:phosphomannomutase
MKKLLLFDIDGTLCNSCEQITTKLLNLLYKMKTKYCLGIVGGSRLQQLEYQFTHNNIPHINKLFDYIFTENGMVGYHNSKLLYKKNMRQELGDVQLTKINNYILRCVLQLDLVKTGSFSELRNGLIYFRPIGNDCTKLDRVNFKELDERDHVRDRIVKDMKKEFPDLDVSVGGNIGVGVSPKNWNKSYVIAYLVGFEEIIFFGDKIYPGGNDYPLAMCDGITSYHHVKSIDETFIKLGELSLP